MNITGKSLGINGHDVLFISSLVEMFPDEDIESLSLKVKRTLPNIHTGHYIYLGLCVGSTIATLSMQSKNQINFSLLCRQN